MPIKNWSKQSLIYHCGLFALSWLCERSFSKDAEGLEIFGPHFLVCLLLPHSPVYLVSDDALGSTFPGGKVGAEQVGGK